MSDRSASTRARPSAITLALAMVLVAGLFLRLYNLDWDDGKYLHPDERFVVDVITSRIVIAWPPDLDNLLDAKHSLLNPRSVDPQSGAERDFAYGALPLIVTDLAGSAMSKLTGDDWSTYGGKVRFVGRFLSALLDTLTALVVYFIGRRLFSRRVGLLAATIAALTPMAIQLAHFFTTDSWLTFFVALCLLWSIEAATTGSKRWFALAGLGFGLAMATKGSVFTLGFIVLFAILLDAVRPSDRERQGDPVLRAGARVLLAAATALAAFALFEPYALARPGVYIDNIVTQSNIVRGIFDVPFTRQYIGTTPVVYHLEQVVRYGYGPIAGLLVVVGVGILALRLARVRDAGLAVLMAWFAGYGLVVALPETKFLRYLAPLMPVFALAAGVAIDAVIGGLRAMSARVLAPLAAAILLVGVAGWTVAFMRVYTDPHPRIAASEWIYTNVTPGSVLSGEYWDDFLPLDLGPGANPGTYQYTWFEFDLYGDRPPTTVAQHLYEGLEQADYIVISSNRVMAGMAQSPWRYPVQIAYYDLLQAGQLGYTLVAEFQTPPGIGPFTVDDRNADESFINYDHPRVLIFQKTRDLPRAEFDALFADAVAQPVTPRRYPEAARQSLEFATPVGELPVVDDARWSERLTGNSLAALAVWIAFLGALQIIGLPFALPLFRRFSDRGWAFARILTLLVAGWAVWLLASVEVIAFRAIWVWAALGLLGVLGWGWPLHGRRRLREALAVPDVRRSILVGEAVFLAVFALFLLFRYLNPDSWHPIWGGEKPMEFTHLNGILRSAHFPPIDPWYSGGFVNYYYYGLYLVAFCLKATGIPSEIAFNLAQPTVMATMAATAYGFAATLGRDLARRRAAAIPAGLAGALLLVGIGNLDTARRIVEALPDAPLPSFDWTWGGSRAIDFAITEFPYFTGLYADLHAHGIAVPITLFIGALAYAMAREWRAPLLAVGAGHPAPLGRLVCQGAMISLALGALFATNAWDFFTYAALVAATFLVVLRGFALPQRLVGAGALSALTVGGGYLAFLPFHQHYVALFGEIARTEVPTNFGQFTIHFGGLILIAALGLVALTVRDRGVDEVFPFSVIASFLGLVAAALLAFWWLLPDASSARTAMAVAAVTIAVLTPFFLGWDGGPLVAGQPWTRFAAPLAAGVALGATLDGRPVLGLAIALLAAAGFGWLTFASTPARQIALMLAAAAGVVGGIEIVFIADDLIGTEWARMNTIFKFYNQVWVLFAVAGGAVIGWWIVERAQPTSHGEPDPEDAAALPLADLPPAHPRGLAGAGIALAITAAIVAASALYPVFATGPRLHERFTTDLGSGTLNALDWMSYGTLTTEAGDVVSFEDDLAVIDWFNHEVPGTPVIAEASIGPYRGNGSRIAIATGLPTILGWDRHESQQRYTDDIDARYADVRTLYRSEDPAEKLTIIERYDVAYIVVGDVERYSLIGGNPSNRYASDGGLAAFESMVGSSLEIAFQSGDTVVYRVVTTPEE